jgi:hypothetical protein
VRTTLTDLTERNYVVLPSASQLQKSTGVAPLEVVVHAFNVSKFYFNYITILVVGVLGQDYYKSIVIQIPRNAGLAPILHKNQNFILYLRFRPASHHVQWVQSSVH